jgi:hypothetical protein
VNKTIVCFRLTEDVWTRYAIEAQRRGVALGTHLRQRLEEQDRLIAELVLRAVAEQSASSLASPSTTSPASDSGTLVEVLILLRTVAGPQNSVMAQKEVERLGLSSWR